MYIELIETIALTFPLVIPPPNLFDGIAETKKNLSKFLNNIFSKSILRPGT